MRSGSHAAAQIHDDESLTVPRTRAWTRSAIWQRRPPSLSAPDTCPSQLFASCRESTEIMGCKVDTATTEYHRPQTQRWRGIVLTMLLSIVGSLVLIDLTARWLGHRVGLDNIHWIIHTSEKDQNRTPLTRTPSEIVYNLTLSQAWRNPDGGHWRPLFVGNSESPFPTINAWEGDLVRINIHNDLLLPTNLHW